MKIFTSKPKDYDKFIESLTSKFDLSKSTNIVLSDWANKRSFNEIIFEKIVEFHDFVNTELNNHSIDTLNIDKQIDNNFGIEGKNKFDSRIRRLYLWGSKAQGLGRDVIFSISNLSVDDLEIRTNSHNLKLHISSCNIKHVQFVNAPDKDSQFPASFELKDTNVSQATFKPASVKKFHMQGGSILEFDVPSSEEENPFSGSCVFDSVFMPTSEKDHYHSDAQPYRNMRRHMCQIFKIQLKQINSLLKRQSVKKNMKEDLINT